MKIDKTPLEGLLVFSPRRFSDDRGYFYETWQQGRYADAGVNVTFVQDNVSKSKRGVLRGMHFQNPNAQGKLVSVLEGEVFDVAVDVRKQSKTYGNWFGVSLSAENGKQLWVPPGFAHGFYVTSETAVFSYKCSDYYAPQAEQCLVWDDPDVAISWPEGEKLLADKDRNGLLLKDIRDDRLIF